MISLALLEDMGMISESFLVFLLDFLRPQRFYIKHNSFNLTIPEDLSEGRHRGSFIY